MKPRRNNGEAKEPKKWQSELRRSLENEAFVNKYPCIRCGAKKDIHIHHLMYTGEKKYFFNKRFWAPLCQKCHMFAHGKEYIRQLTSNRDYVV